MADDYIKTAFKSNKSKIKTATIVIIITTTIIMLTLNLNSEFEFWIIANLEESLIRAVAAAETINIEDTVTSVEFKKQKAQELQQN